jgi:putative transcription factor
MANCDMCGKEEQLFRTSIEGSFIEVCRACTSFGKVVSSQHHAQTQIKPTPLPQELEEPAETLVADFGQRIKQAREKLGLEQKDFAQKVSEKMSMIHKMETGAFKPSISLAHKLEKMLHIQLIETAAIESAQTPKAHSDQVTIGDLIKL